MKPNEILEAAKEAGILGSDAPGFFFAHTQELERFAAIIEKRTIERCEDEFHLCLSSDLEHGVKCLNEKAAEDFKLNYPALSRYAAAIRKLGEQ